MYIKICINDLCDNVIPYMCTIIAKEQETIGSIFTGKCIRTYQHHASQRLRQQTGAYLGYGMQCRSLSNDVAQFSEVLQSVVCCLGSYPNDPIGCHKIPTVVSCCVLCAHASTCKGYFECFLHAWSLHWYVLIQNGTYLVETLSQRQIRFTQSSRLQCCHVVSPQMRARLAQQRCCFACHL